MGRAGASASQAKEVSPAGGWIGIRLSPSREGLEKGPLSETRLGHEVRMTVRPDAPRAKEMGFGGVNVARLILPLIR